MKHLSIRALLSLFVFSSLSCLAQDSVIPKYLIVVTKPNVNLRQAPNSTGAIVMKAPIGTVFEMVSKQPGWYEVKEAWAGKQAFISASVAKQRIGNDSIYTMSSESIVGLPEAPYMFENIHKTKNSETITTYTISAQEKNSNIVDVSLSTTYADTSGRMRTDEQNYKGKKMGWYVVLTEEIDYEKNVNKMEQPILIFKESTGKSGIYVQGTYYKEGGNPFE